jgi:membrane-associated phospholipid phosphatase
MGITTALVILGAKYLIALPVFVAAVYGAFFVAGERLRFALVTLGSAVLSYGAARGVGLLYSHPQPFALQGFTPLVSHAVDNSFPSDHTALAAALAAVVFYYNKPVGLLLFGVAVLIGLCRVIAGLHYGIDIVAGALLGVMSSALLFFIAKYFSPAVR